jgi:hypothetical protein
LGNFPAIWYILWHFGIFCGHLVYFPRFGILYYEKSGNPGPTQMVGGNFSNETFSDNFFGRKKLLIKLATSSRVLTSDNRERAALFRKKKFLFFYFILEKVSTVFPGNNKELKRFRRHC